MRIRVARYFHCLNQLQKMIFAGYLRRDYIIAKQDYEREMLHAKNNLFKSMEKVRSIKADYLIARLEHLYEIILSLNNLKYRIFDASTFEVCAREFTDLTNELSVLFEIKQIALLDGDKLTSLIENVESLYQGTLRIVTADPMAFLFFIQNLKALRDELMALQVDWVQHEN